MRLTVWRVLLYYLHGAYDAWFLAVRVVEEREVPFLHGAEIVAGYIHLVVRFGPGGSEPRQVEPSAALKRE